MAFASGFISNKWCLHTCMRLHSNFFNMSDIIVPIMVHGALVCACPYIYIYLFAWLAVASCVNIYTTCGGAT
jgi:hypothetical protein